VYDAVVPLIEEAKYPVSQNLLGRNAEFVLQKLSEHQPIKTLQEHGV